jgi:ferredoxin
MNMKFKVNENCIACGMCAGTCPEVFHMNDETGLAEAIPEDVAPEVEDSAKEAMANCPAGAIEEA